jgi:hypothetical protein
MKSACFGQVTARSPKSTAKVLTLGAIFNDLVLFLGSIIKINNIFFNFANEVKEHLICPSDMFLERLKYGQNSIR